jgi:SAM-dependent methyltransferase
MTDYQKPQTDDDLQELARDFTESRVFLTALQLSVFNELGDEHKTSDELAEKLNADPRGLDRLLNSLVVLGLLEKKDSKFSNTPLTSKYLLEDSPHYITNLMHVVHRWDSWSTLTDAVREGGTVYERPEGKAGEERTESFISAMNYGAVRRAEEFLDIIDMDGVSRFLDIGGGSGAFSIAFVRAHPQLRATVFDLPKVIPLTRGYIKDAGLEDRIDTVEGDYHTDYLGEGYDLALLSQIIHSNSLDENHRLIKKAVDALNTGGRLIIQDFILDEDRTTPPRAVLFALNMLVATEEGDTYTESEVRDMMEDAGLSDIERIETSHNTTLMVGRKV